MKYLLDANTCIRLLNQDNDRCAHDYGLIRADLAAQGKPIGANDLMIAAISRAHDLILVTHNTSEFSRVVGLRIEDWESA